MEEEGLRVQQGSTWAVFKSGSSLAPRCRPDFWWGIIPSPGEACKSSPELRSVYQCAGGISVLQELLRHDMFLQLFIFTVSRDRLVNELLQGWCAVYCDRNRLDKGLPQPVLSFPLVAPGQDASVTTLPRYLYIDSQPPPER